MPGLCIIPERALADRECSGARLRALCAIGTFTNREGGGVWAANETIAERAKMDEREFRRAAAWLVERGYVRKRVRYKATGAQDTNQLQIVLDEPDEEAAQGGGGNPPTPQRGEGEIPPPRVGASPPPPLGEIPPPRGGGDSPTKRTPLNDPTTNTAAPATLAGEFADARHRDAYLALRAQHRNPPLLDIALRSVHQPPTGGAQFAWEIIGAGLLEQLGNGESFNVSRLRGYCRQTLARQQERSGSVVRSDYPGGFVGVQPWQRFAAVTERGRAYTAAEFWELCRVNGLLQGMLTRATLDEIVQRLEASGAIHDAAAFTSLVLHVEPWTLAEIKFAKTREERLAMVLAAWTVTAQGAA